MCATLFMYTLHEILSTCTRKITVASRLMVIISSLVMSNGIATIVETIIYVHVCRKAKVK